MTDAQIQLQNALTTTFLANLAFLAEYDNELYHKIDELSRMIENGTYQERYALEFIMENGEFDIYDIVNNKYLYNKNPKKINDELIRKIELDEKNLIVNIADYVLQKSEPGMDINNRFSFFIQREFTSLSIENMHEYTNILGDKLENKKKRLKRIEKFIFFGTLLGRHIPKIANKIDANIYLVLERNLEIFRLSLFTLDYKILAQKGVVFSIMDEDLQEQIKIKSFLDAGYLYNYLLKFSSTNINIDDYIDKVLSLLDMEKPTGYDYNRQLYSNINRTTKYIQNKYKILLFDENTQRNNIFNNFPILYVAAGPSVDENINWIKENQDRFIIVTIGAIYKKLLDHDIRVDIITSLDEQYFILNNKQFTDEDVARISDNTIIIASTITNETILKKFNPNNVFLYEVFVPLHKNNFAFDGFSIGELTLGILLKLNAKEIYLIGLDFALNQETGSSHSESTKSGIFKLNLESNTQNRDLFSTTGSLIKTKGNLKNTVYTTAKFFASIKSAENYTTKRNSEVKIFNLSENGAFITGTIPTNINEFDLSNFKSLSLQQNKLKTFFNNISITTIDDATKISLENQILFIENELNNILYEIKNNDFKTFNELFEKIFIFVESIFKNQNINLYSIIINYLKINSSYLFYHFNDLKTKDETKKVKKVKLIFINQVESLLNDYTLCIKRILN